MLPVIVMSLVAVPLLIAAVVVVRRRSSESAELANDEDEEHRALMEAEFAEAEAYQERWREEQHERENGR